MAGLECRAAPWQERRMASRSPAAGGFFLILAILAGFVLGVTLGRPLEGVLLGTLGGTAIAILVWLVDRRKERR